MPNSGKGNSRLSKRQSEPGGFFSLFSAVNHWASRTFTTNQPSPTGASPELESSSRASGTARVYALLSPLRGSNPSTASGECALEGGSIGWRPVRRKNELDRQLEQRTQLLDLLLARHVLG